MFQLFFLNLWSNIKRAPLISVILLLQITLLSFCLLDIVFNHSQSEIINETYQKAYSENTTFQIRPNQGTPYEELDRASARFFVSSENSGMEVYERFYEYIEQSEDIKSAMLLAGKKTDGDYYFVDQDYIDIFGLILDSGRLFTSNEFTEFDPDCVPVLLGYNFKEDYSIGDTFVYDLFADETCKVVGFLAQGQVFMEGVSPRLFDDKMVFPYISNSLAYWENFCADNKHYSDEIKSFVRYYSSGLGANNLSGRVYVIEKGRENILIDYMTNALEKTGLIEFYSIRPYATVVANYVADELNEKNVILSLLVIILIVFSLISVTFSSINNVSNNMKAYAVHSLSGATRNTILMYCGLETLLYCLIGFTCGFALKYWDFVRLSLTEHPAFFLAVNKIIILAFIYAVLACTLSLLFVFLKLKRYSIAELIRGREVKKSKRQPVYRVLFFIIIMLISVSITFLNTYSYQLSHIDRYQNNFISNDAGVFYLQKLEDKNAPEVELFYEVDNASEYVIEMSVNTFYDEVLGPKVRGWYFNGEYGIPEVTDGRFFTLIEISQISDYAVVGKNVLNDFVTEKDGKQFITYGNKEYEVIGIVGREGHDTTVDDWVFLTLPTVLEQYSCEGRPIIIDGSTGSDRDTVSDHIIAMANGHYSFIEQEAETKLDLGVSGNVLDISVLMIFITAIVFCSYYVDQLKKTIYVKKLIGFSRFIIFIETFIQFVSISSVTFVFGNGLLFIASKTLLRNVEFFSAFTFNFTSIAVSFGMILLLSLLISVLAINKAFRGSARDLKKN